MPLWWAVGTIQHAFVVGNMEREGARVEKGESVTRFGGPEIVENPGSSEGSARGQGAG